MMDQLLVVVVEQLDLDHTNIHIKTKVVMEQVGLDPNNTKIPQDPTTLMLDHFYHYRNLTLHHNNNDLVNQDNHHHNNNQDNHKMMINWNHSKVMGASPPINQPPQPPPQLPIPPLLTQTIR